MLAAVGRLVGSHHERLDGSGYHRGTPAQLLGLDARILAADVYQALVSQRPQRPAHTPAEAARMLVRGRSEGQIAAELFIAPSTVHTHVVHIYEKAGVPTRAGAGLRLTSPRPWRTTPSRADQFLASRPGRADQRERHERQPADGRAQR